MAAKKYVLNRDYTLRTLMGHCITFAKGEPTLVPPSVERDVIAIGGECIEQEKTDPLDPEKQAEKIYDDTEREELLTEAFKVLIGRNESKDFTGAGVPNVKAIERLVPFDVERNEITALWHKQKEAEVI